MKFPSNVFYTAQVCLHVETYTTGLKTIEFKDIQGDHINFFQENVWKKGVIHIAPNGVIELINPYKISHVILMKQDKKYNQ